MTDHVYTKADVENAELMGKVTQSLLAFTDSQKQVIDSQEKTVSRLDQFELMLRDLVNTKVSKEELKYYVTKKELEIYDKSLEPIRIAYQKGVNWMARIFVLLIVGLVGLLAILFGGKIPLLN